MKNQINEEKLNGTLAWIRKLSDLISEVYSTKENQLSNSVRTHLFSIQEHVKRVMSLLSMEGSQAAEVDQEILTIVDRAGRLEKSLGNNDVPLVTKKYLKELVVLIRQGARELVAISVVRSNDAVSNLHGNLKDAEIRLKKISDEFKALESARKSLHQSLEQNRSVAQVTEKSIEQLNERLETELNSAKVTTLVIIDDLKQKQNEVNELIGIISGTSVAGSYGKSADSEKKWADATRNGSVFLMLAIGLIIGYSLLETGTPHFEWQTSLFRLIFSLSLSVPAAYLARESTKHRAKQHEYMRMSLDLQSITPYLASLPEDDQHRLKAEMANRLFGGNTPTNQVDSYPIDIQSILMALVSKFDGSKNQASASVEK